MNMVYMLYTSTHKFETVQCTLPAGEMKNVEYGIYAIYVHTQLSSGEMKNVDYAPQHKRGL